MNSRHGLWWQAYVAALSSGRHPLPTDKVGGKAVDAAAAIDHQRAVALADLGLAELERRIAADAAADTAPPEQETEEQKRQREADLKAKRERTMLWSVGG